MTAPTRTLTLRILGAVEDDGALVGRLATTVRVISGTDRLLVLVGDPVPDPAPIIGHGDGAMALVVRALMAQLEAVTTSG